MVSAFGQLYSDPPFPLHLVVSTHHSHGFCLGTGFEGLGIGLRKVPSRHHGIPEVLEGA